MDATQRVKARQTEKRMAGRAKERGREDERESWRDRSELTLHTQADGDAAR